MTNFEACMKDARKLVTATFIPELDNLVNNDVASILNKVIIETDLMMEGHTDYPKMARARKLAQVVRFVEKWAGAAVECEEVGLCIDFLRENGKDVSSLVAKVEEKEAEEEEEAAEEEEAEAADESPRRELTAEEMEGYVRDLSAHIKELFHAHSLRMNSDILNPFLPIYRAIEYGDYSPADAVRASADYADAMAVYVEACRIIKARQEEEEQKERERREREARRAAILQQWEERGDGFRVNPAAVLDVYHVDESEDMELIDDQLNNAPLFHGIYPRMIYRRRAPIMYKLTNGAEVLEAQAVEFSDYMTRFIREVENALQELYYNMTYTDFERMAQFWRNSAAMRRGVTENRISAEDMAAHGIRSPKFSKHLVRTFGERSTVVRLFNDRPKAEEVEKETPRVIEGKKVIVSNLAANVMKMSAENAFSSCQNFTYEDICDLDYLQCLPSSVHDETMAIAYIVDEEEDYRNPYMLARYLIAPHVYNGQTFFIAHNLYYDEQENAKVLKASLKNLYGGRILFADEMYNSGQEMAEYRHAYGYNLVVYFDYDMDCYMCEGSGEVEAVVRWHDYHFTTDCPICEGSGENPDGGEYGSLPYIDNRSFVKYEYGEKVTRADESKLMQVLADELDEQQELTA